MQRRNFFKTTLLGAAACATLAEGASPAQAASPASSMETEAEALTHKLFADDGLVRSIADRPTVSDLAKGKDRTLVLGGGGEYYVAWYCGFFHGLQDQGLDMEALSEMVVGTSAGSYMGSSLTSGHFATLLKQFDFFGHFPAIFAKMAPLSSPNISQKRALALSAAAKDGSIETIRAIGRAGLASNNTVNGPSVERLAGLLTGDSQTDWPAAKMFTTAMDCYTGERLIVHQAVAKKNGIPLAHGAAASSSLPGIMGPTVLGQRFAMDGGICSNPAHVDVVAGSKRALIITLTDGVKPPFLTGIPHPLARNIKDIEATGTKTLWIVANPPDVNLLDPKQIGPALQTGYDRAKVEGPRIKQFWA